MFDNPVNPANPVNLVKKKTEPLLKQSRAILTDL
jgi:hypothetical protein